MVTAKQLANLRPWQKGESGNPAGNPTPGPKIAPAMHRYANMPYEDIIALASDVEKASKLPMADVIAITSLIKAAKDVPWGDKMREFVAERLDGGVNKGQTINDNRIQVLIREVVGVNPMELG